MKNLQLLAISLALIFFSACSSKRVYEPESVVSSWDNQGSIQSPIVDVTSDVALLENRKVLTTTKTLDVQVDESYRLLATTDGWVISSTIDGKLKLQYTDSSDLVENFQLKKTIAGASVKDDILAVLFADNEMALYSISSKELLLREQGGDVIAVDSRIVNPYFMNDLVMFATLDGKIIILNSKLKKKLRTVIVSSEDNFNNVIYFNILDNKIIVATAYKILSMGKKEIREKYEIRNVANDGNNIFITTKQGDIVSLTSDLQLNAKLKFPFAHFLGLIIHNDKIYALEKEGYLIELSKDLQQYSIYEVEIEDGYIFAANNIFYIDDE